MITYVLLQAADPTASEPCKALCTLVFIYCGRGKMQQNHRAFWRFPTVGGLNVILLRSREREIEAPKLCSDTQHFHEYLYSRKFPRCVIRYLGSQGMIGAAVGGGSYKHQSPCTDPNKAAERRFSSSTAAFSCCIEIHTGGSVLATHPTATPITPDCPCIPGLQNVCLCMA